MVKRNPHLAKLNSSYLFSFINQKKKKFIQENPGIELISLGVGDTTQPIPPYIANSLSQAAANLGTKEGYSGYGIEQGMGSLRKKIAERIYQNKIDPEEIFVSDGAKCDIGRLQVLFGKEITVAVQDPSYPVYVDGSVLQGVTGNFEPHRGHYEGIVYMQCLPENHFFPSLHKMPNVDLIYICSPNNPTGYACTRKQLEELVNWAILHRALIIYDAAYSIYIRDKAYPKSIYEIEGARKAAIEINSFSKMAGFTGVRLGWTVVPQELSYEDGSSVHVDWHRINTTIFNGASNIAQWGGMAVLDEKGWPAVQQQIDYYLENTKILREALHRYSIEFYGGIHAPYLWVRFPGKKSWDIFDWFLQKGHLITTPGSGFGPCGEGFVRLSALGDRESIHKAVQRFDFLK